MSKLSKKILLISGAVLLGLSAGGTGLSQVNNSPVSANVTANASQTSKYRLGLRASQQDAKIFYNKLAENYSGVGATDTSMSPFLVMTLTYHHAPLNNHKYQTGYLKGFNHYAKQTRYTKKNHRKYSYSKEYGHLISTKNYQKAVQSIHFIKRQPNAKAYLAGYVNILLQMASSSNMTTPYSKALGINDYTIAKKYRNSLAFAKGFLLSNANKISNESGLNSLFSENQYENYLGSGGKIPYKKLLSKHYQKLYNLYWKVTVHDEHNALTKAQGLKYDKYINKKYHLTKADKNFMDYLYENVTIQNVNTDNNIHGTGRYIWNNVGFASNLRKKAPFTIPVNFSKYVINNISDGCLDKSDLSGYIIGLKNDNTKQARRTAKAFKAYVTNMYAKKPSRKVSRQFKKYYGIKTLAKGQVVTGHKIYHSVGVSVYRVYNKHAKHSTISFYMPSGRGPIDFEPEVEG